WRMLVLGFIALLVKAVHVQAFSTEFLQQQGERRYERTVVLPATRGKVFDRTGEVVLASSVAVKAIWALPEDAKKATPEQVAKLASLLEMSPDEVQRRINTEDRSFVYLRRQVEMELAKEIASLKIPGIHDQDEVRRSYPQGEVMAHVTGFTDIEDQGIEGIELSFKQELSGTAGSRRVMRDRLGNIIEDVRDAIPPVNGQDLQLSIDAALQY